MGRLIGNCPAFIVIAPIYLNYVIYIMLSQRMFKMQFSFTLCKIKFRVQRVQKYHFRALRVSTSFRQKSEFTKSIYIKLKLYNISKIYVLQFAL